MALVNGVLSVTTGAAQKLTTSQGNKNVQGTLFVVNNGANPIFVGGPAVTTANGIPIPANGSISMTVPPGEDVWACCSTGPNDVRFMTTMS